MFINTDSLLTLYLILRIIITQIKILIKKKLLIQGLYVVEAPCICKQTLNTFLDPMLTQLNM